MAITLNGTTGIVTPKLDALDLELNGVNVVERGSNANGDYVRFADGTQICRVVLSYSVDSMSVAGSVFTQSFHPLWTFPAAFSFNPTANVTSNSAEYWTTSRGATTTYFSMQLFSYGNTPGTRSVYIIAIGRWY